MHALRVESRVSQWYPFFEMAIRCNSGGR